MVASYCLQLNKQNLAGNDMKTDDKKQLLMFCPACGHREWVPYNEIEDRLHSECPCSEAKPIMVPVLCYEDGA